MAFNLFNKKKENIDKIQTDEIKNATIDTTNLDSSKVDENSQDLNNPFAKQEIDLNLTPNQIENTNNLNSQNEIKELNSTNNSQNLNQNQEFFNNQNQLQNNFENLNEEKDNVNYDKIQELIDETVEKLIEEKWEKLLSSVDKVLKWKDKQENQMNLIKEDVVFLKDNLEKIESKIMNKISSYDRNILDVNSEIKAMEKVFQKITPTLINNVNELSKIAEEFKDVKPKNKIIEEN